MLSKLLESKEIFMDSFELRIGMVFNQYLCRMAGDGWFPTYSRDILKQELDKIDFSNDMLVALHFALNPDVPEDQEKVDGYVYQPKIVLFNPLIYNEAVLSLAKGEYVENPANY